MAIRAVVTAADELVTLDERELRTAAPDEAVVRVQCFSPNRGEVSMATSKPPGSTIGWDVAGVVERPARKGGPAAGTRVVGFCRAQDGWAEKALIPVRDLAPVPDEVTLETAAALPVAAGTALAAIDAAGGGLLGRRVLVTGSTGGVGSFAVQLAHAAGALVTAQVRSADHSAIVAGLGADEIVVTEDGRELIDRGPFRLVLDGVGGMLLRRAIERLEIDGLAVSYGVTGSAELDLPLRILLGKGLARIRGLNLYSVSDVEPPRVWLARLLTLVRHERLRVDFGRRASWTEVHQVCRDLMSRRFYGKAVLSLP